MHTYTHTYNLKIGLPGTSSMPLLDVGGIASLPTWYMLPGTSFIPASVISSQFMATTLTW